MTRGRLLRWLAQQMTQILERAVKAREISVRDEQIMRLQAENARQLAALQMREQQVAEKYRAKLEAVTNELRTAQKGLTSGCGCPIGVCLRKPKDGACWMQWAAAYAVRTRMDTMIAELQRQGNHPSRFRALTNMPFVVEGDRDVPAGE